MSKFANKNNNNNVYYNAIWHSFFWHFDTSSSVTSLLVMWCQNLANIMSKVFPNKSKQYKLYKMENYNDNLLAFCLCSSQKNCKSSERAKAKVFWATNKGTRHKEEGMKFALLSHDLFVTLTHIFLASFLSFFFFVPSIF